MLTETQRTWLYGQLLLDDGAKACPACEGVDLGAYCHLCGKEKADSDTTMRGCPSCRMLSQGPYCMHCGTLIRDPMVEQLEEGTFDWDEWKRSLQPFLSGITVTERQALQKEEILRDYSAP